MRSIEEIQNTTRVVAEHRFVVRRSLIDAKSRGDVVAAKSLESALRRIDQATDSLRREMTAVEQKSVNSSKDFQRRSSFREQLQRARGEL